MNASAPKTRHPGRRPSRPETQTIQALGGVIAEVAEAAAQIAASAGQQATGLTQIHQAMRDISQVSTQNLVATQQAQKAAGDLTVLGDTLRTLLATR